MAKSRVTETNIGLQGEFIAKEYDNIMRESRDKDHLYTDEIIKFFHAPAFRLFGTFPRPFGPPGSGPGGPCPRLLA